MYKTISLLLAGIVAVVLMAPSAGSQSRKATLEDVMRDVLNVQNSVTEMQRSADTKNAEMKALLEQVLTRFSAIDSSVHKLGDSLASIKAADEKSVRELGEARIQLNAIQKGLDGLNQLNLDQSLTDLKSQMTALKKQVGDLDVGPPVLGAKEAFMIPSSDLTSGFYDDAIAGFKEFLNNFPKDDRAPLARISIGNAFVAKKQYEQAVIEFDLAIQTWPESDKKCTALYKKGLTLVLDKQNPKARAAFEAVGKECPTSAEAPLAADELKKLPRGARGQ